MQTQADNESNFASGQDLGSQRRSGPMANWYGYHYYQNGGKETLGHND